MALTAFPRSDRLIRELEYAALGGIDAALTPAQERSLAHAIRILGSALTSADTRHLAGLA